MPAEHSQTFKLERLQVRFEADESRVITRPFFPGGETRIGAIIDRVIGLSDLKVEEILTRVFRDFQSRHKNIRAVFEEHCERAAKMTGRLDGMPQSRRLLIGAYFTMEYAVQSAALFNPSIVPHINQSGVPEGSVRFVMSLRATGEGHISSIVFRSGIIHADQTLEFDQPGLLSRPVRLWPDRKYEKRLFRKKLDEIGLAGDAVGLVMHRLPDYFTFDQLEHAVAEANVAEPEKFQLEETTDGILWLARSNYHLEIPRDADISEVVIFPQSENESRGIEDLRMVRFTDDDGSVTYFGTYTAYNGYRVLSQLIETSDFHRLAVHTLNGARAQNKGMALFPRRIDGHYVMCSRIDGENLYIMYSDFIHFWETAELLETPRNPWEFVQIGN
jgi:predicted GH43/DUF377 family glycosyl hydrolase